MSYEKQNFVKGQILKADHLNHMEDGIAAAAVGVQGPKGDKGDVGPQGPKGDKGDTGPAATLDPTLSVSGNAADAKATGDAVSQLKEDIDGMFKGLSSSVARFVLTLDDFTYGFVNGATGAIVVQKNRAITKDYLPDGLTRMACATPYQMRVSAWVKETGAFVGNWTGSGWGNTNAQHQSFDAFVPEYKYKICVVNTSSNADYTDFMAVAASVSLDSEHTGGTSAEVVEALRRKTVQGTSLSIADAIAGAPMRCACDSPITLAGLNLSPVGEVSVSVYKQVPLETPIPAGTYTLSVRCESTDTDSELAMLRVGSKYIRIAHDDTRHSASFTLTEEAADIYFYAGSNASLSAGDTAFWRDVMLVAGTEDKPYEPPVETVTCDAGELALLAQTNVLTADTPMDITYIVRSAFLESLLSATKAAELNALTLGYVTPEMLGAAADGVTDDAQAVQACIDLAAELGYPAKCMRSYAVASTICIGSNQDIEINALAYTGTDCAVKIVGSANRLSVKSLTSAGTGLVMEVDTQQHIVNNDVDCGTVSAASHGIVLRAAAASTKGMTQNCFKFRYIRAGGDGCCCIKSVLEQPRGESSFISENTFWGGSCTNADWAYEGSGGNFKFYNFHVEGYIKGGFHFIGSADALVIGDRHAESMRDGEYPYIKIEIPDGIVPKKDQSVASLRYISPIALYVNTIDVSGIPTYTILDTGNLMYLRSNGSLGCIDCRIISWQKPGTNAPGTGESTAKVSQYFAERALIWGPCLIFQGVPEKYWQVTESMDLRTITEDTPAMPTVFDIACAGAEIWLHPSYCFMGISRFEVMQTAEYTATIYDYYTGNVVFDGGSLGAGEYEVRTFLDGNFARLNGEGMIWKVRRIC